MHEQFLDIGARSREEALRRIAVGDPITFAPRFLELADDTYATLAADDRAGVYVAFRALELYKAAPGAASLVALSTVHEETTFMGAKAHARRLSPEAIIVVDVDFATDYPGMDVKKTGGEVKLGAGPVLARGTGSNARLFQLAAEVAQAEGIALQVRGGAGQHEHRRRRAHGGRRRHALAERAGALHALALRGGPRRRHGGRRHVSSSPSPAVSARRSIQAGACRESVRERRPRGHQRRLRRGPDHGRHARVSGGPPLHAGRRGSGGAGLPGRRRHRGRRRRRPRERRQSALRLAAGRRVAGLRDRRRR